MSARTLERIKLGINPNTGRPSIFRHGSNIQIALEEKDATIDVLMCFVAMMLHGTEHGQQKSIKINGKWYMVGAIEIEDPAIGRTEEVPPVGEESHNVSTEEPQTHEN